MRRPGIRHVRATTLGEPAPFQLSPPGDSSAQTIPDFRGTQGQLHSGHMVWLPDAVTIGGVAWRYYQASNYPVVFMMGGQGATPSTTVNNALPRFKSSISAGQIPPCIIVFPNTRDPDDAVEGWGLDAANGSYPLETMLRLDLPAYIEEHTRAGKGYRKRAMVGFSKGGFETLRMRAKFGITFAAVYVVVDAPRPDADLGGAAQTYNTFSAAEKTKLFGDSSAHLQKESPFATTAGTGLFNVLGADAGGLGPAPLLMIESDPGGGAPATNAAAMNNAQTRLTGVSAAFTLVNVDNAGATPSHNLAAQFDVWIAEATNHMGWMVSNGWG